MENNQLETARKLFAELQASGVFNYSLPPSPDSAKILQDAEKWLSAIDKHINTIPDTILIRVLEHYDIIYRAVHSRPADRSLFTSHYKTLLQKHLDGNTDIPVEDLRAVIEREKNIHHNPDFAEVEI